VAVPAGVEFLSDEWFDALSVALQRVEVADGSSLVLGQVVTELPFSLGGEVRYTIALGGGQPARLERGSVETAEVVLVVPFPDARGLATGTASGASLIAAGRITIRGDASRLVEAAAIVEAAAAATSDVHRIVT
jgi:hypothetical protein